MKIHLSLHCITLLLNLALQTPHVLSISISQQESSFLLCLQNNSLPSNILFTPENPQYTNLFFSSIQNNRTLFSSPKPFLIMTPTHGSHVSAAVLCSKKLNIPLRTRSGGHDYEGLSYTTTSSSFVLIELRNFRSVNMDLPNNTVWVEAGATLGELYYAIATRSKTIAFPAGICPTVGVGGHFSGGGIGTIMRSFSLAIDNIVDAKIVTANGEILNRDSMGEDLFWAIKGGGGASFGVILSYKLQLVKVPPKVTVFNINKILATRSDIKLLTKWQSIAYNIDNRLFIRVILKVVNVDRESNKNIQATFQSLFLGEISELLPIMGESFPELELQSNDCMELNWIRAVLNIAGYSHNEPLEKLLTVLNIAGYSQNEPLEKLLSRAPQFNNLFKIKSDFLTKLITDEQWEVIFSELLKGEEHPFLIIEPFGGRVDEINEAETPFPHRNGSLYNIQHIITWEDPGMEVAEKYIDRMREFYDFMTPYVSNNPRTAYLNYRDLDLGRNLHKNASYLEARVWGEKYFKGNFRRLAYVKAKVDPENLFWNVQSIPPLA
ncbi:berberine bridge enzyme-like 22 [Phalaenopsis equestris]|uniref:berberine bridge enzyme-like 22 n=1 Tax=Phalaenopsis equestris TaxID=78828 RepID=UPI0009E3C27E|nr:berberine bridge enzyme-like 22 [Phalaenopsis equestris]